MKRNNDSFLGKNGSHILYLFEQIHQHLPHECFLLFIDLSSHPQVVLDDQRVSNQPIHAFQNGQKGALLGMQLRSCPQSHALVVGIGLARGILEGIVDFAEDGAE
jgi:hypothetical protein